MWSKVKPWRKGQKSESPNCRQKHQTMDAQMTRVERKFRGTSVTFEGRSVVQTIMWYPMLVPVMKPVGIRLQNLASPMVVTFPGS